MFIPEQFVTGVDMSVAIDVVYALGYHMEIAPGSQMSWNLFDFASDAFIGEFNSIVDLFDYVGVRVPLSPGLRMMVWQEPCLN